jgi:hypothetical protein
MSINNITEFRFFRVVTDKFGTILLSRFDKLEEEMNELFEARDQLHDAYSSTVDFGEVEPERRHELMEHLKDEVCDVYGILTHIAGLLGMNQREMLDTVLDKLKQRETDPEYKKQKQSVN